MTNLWTCATHGLYKDDHFRVQRQVFINWVGVSQKGQFSGGGGEGGWSTQRRQAHYPLSTRHLGNVSWALDQMTIKITLPTLVSFSAARPWESLKMKWPFDLELATTTTACIKAFQHIFFHLHAKVKNQRAPALSGSQNAAGLTQPRIGTGSMALFGLGCSQITLILNGVFLWGGKPQSLPPILGGIDFMSSGTE